MRMLRRAIAALLCLVAPLAATAEDVTLTSRDGAIEISGTLRGFDGEFYRVETPYGILTIDGEAVVCTGPACPEIGAWVPEIVLSGSPALARTLVPDLITTFAARRGWVAEIEVRSATETAFVLRPARNSKPVARFTIVSATSRDGLDAILEGRADMAMTVRAVQVDEAARARKLGLGRLDTPELTRVVALDALVAASAPQNPIGRISAPDLAGILSGEIDNWRALGWVDAPIVVHLPTIESGFGEAVAQQIVDATGITLRGDIHWHGSVAELADAVAADPLAFGVLPWSQSLSARPLAIAGSCGFGVTASADTIRTADYPLVTPLTLVLAARRLPLVGREFLDFLTTPAASQTAERAGFVGQAPAEIPLARQGERLANAIAAAGQEIGLDELKRLAKAMRGSRRLTATFRFRPGGTEFTTQSAANVELLARDLEAGAFDGRRLRFVGFSDGQGPADANRELSRARAAAVRDAILAAAPAADMSRTPIEIDAFGEALPMACDDTPDERGINRRVEIWLDRAAASAEADTDQR